MITQLWEIVTQVVSGLIDSLVSAFSGITEVFYLEGVDGGFTIPGQFLLIALGFTIVFFVFRFVKSLIQR